MSGLLKDTFINLFTIGTVTHTVMTLLYLWYKIKYVIYKNIIETLIFLQNLKLSLSHVLKLIQNT